MPAPTASDRLYSIHNGLGLNRIFGDLPGGTRDDLRGGKDLARDEPFYNRWGSAEPLCHLLQREHGPVGSIPDRWQVVGQCQQSLLVGTRLRTRSTRTGL